MKKERKRKGKINKQEEAPDDGARKS